MLLSSGDHEMFDANYAWLVHEDCMYTLQKKGLQKYSLESFVMRGRLVNFNYDCGEDASQYKASFVLIEGQLYMRHKSAKPAPFSKVDMETLAVTRLSNEEMEKFPATPEEGEEITRTLRWEPQNELTGRCLEQAPLFTDGRYLYTIARMVPTAKALE
jgi:hypothetical protein